MKTHSHHFPRMNVNFKIRTAEEISAEHKAADARCGRDWECACAACNQQRQAEAKQQKTIN